VSQLVMRSFDVPDKGELNKEEGPLGRRGERTPDHCHHSLTVERKREKKRRKVWVEAGSSQTGHKGFLLQTIDHSLSTSPLDYYSYNCQAFHSCVSQTQSTMVTAADLPLTIFGNFF